MLISIVEVSVTDRHRDNIIEPGILPDQRDAFKEELTHSEKEMKARQISKQTSQTEGGFNKP